MMVLDKKSRNLKCHYQIILWGKWITVPNYCNGNLWSRHFKQNHECQRYVGAWGKVKGSLKSVGFIHWGPCMSAHKINCNKTVGLEIFQSESKWWTDRPTLPFLEPCFFMCAGCNFERMLNRIIHPACKNHCEVNTKHTQSFYQCYY